MTKSRELPQDVIVNYVLEGEQELFLAQSNKFNNVTIGIKPCRGIEIYSHEEIEEPQIAKANELAMAVLFRTKDYQDKALMLENLKSKITQIELHTILCTIFKQWNPDSYVPDKNNKIFFKGYRQTMRRDQQ